MCCPCRHQRFCPEAAYGCVPFSIVLVPDLVLGWCWVPGHCGCRNQGDCVAAWDLGCLCDRFLLGSVQSRYGSKVKCEVDRTGVILLEKESLHTSPQGLSTGDVQFCDSAGHLVYVLTKSDAARSASGPTPAVCMLTMGSEVQPGPHPSPLGCLHAARPSPLPGRCVAWEFQRLMAAHVNSPAHCAFGVGNCGKMAAVNTGLLPLLLASQLSLKQSPGSSGRPSSREGGFTE